jgi:ArsR family transcriptional regulator
MISAQTLFDSLSDPTRRRILALLQSQGELCVCELVSALGMAQPKISRHLAVMRESSLTSMRKEGTWVYYRLHPDLPLWAYRILEISGRDAPEQETTHDLTRLSGMADRPIRCCS